MGFVIHCAVCSQSWPIGRLDRWLCRNDKAHPVNIKEV